MGDAGATGIGSGWAPVRVVLLLVLAAGCAKRSGVPGQGPEGWQDVTPAPTTENAPTTEPGPASEDVPPSVATEAIRQLEVDIETIRTSAVLQHHDVVAALGHLADAIVAIEGRPDDPEVKDLRASTERLALADPLSQRHTELAEKALLDALQALTTLAGADPSVLPQLARTRGAVARLDDARPLVEQTEPVAEALDQLSEMLDTLRARPGPRRN